MTWFPGMRPIVLLLQLFPGNTQCLTVSDYHVVTAILTLVIDGLVLSYQRHSNGRCQPTECSFILGDIYMMPQACKRQSTVSKLLRHNSSYFTGLFQPSIVLLIFRPARLDIFFLREKKICCSGRNLKFHVDGVFEVN